MPRLMILRGFSGAKKKRGGKKTTRARRHHKKSSGKAHTPQAMRFKRAVQECGKQSHSGSLHSAQKAMGACIRKKLKK